MNDVLRSILWNTYKPLCLMEMIYSSSLQLWSSMHDDGDSLVIDTQFLRGDVLHIVRDVVF